MNNNNEEIDKNHTTLKVLEERITKNEEIVNLKFATFRNYVVIIVVLITLFGFGAIYTVIEGVVKTSTENKLNEILTEEYVENKIYKLSEKTITKLIHEIDKKAKKIIEESFSFTDSKEKATESYFDGNYKMSLRYSKQAISKLKNLALPESDYYNRELTILYLEIIELQILNNDFEAAKSTLKEVFPILSNIKYEIVYYFFESITNKILGFEVLKSEDKFKNILKMVKKERLIGWWHYYGINSWVKNSDISEDKKEYIIKMIKLIEQSS